MFSHRGAVIGAPHGADELQPLDLGLHHHRGVRDIGQLLRRAAQQIDRLVVHALAGPCLGHVDVGADDARGDRLAIGDVAGLHGLDQPLGVLDDAGVDVVVAVVALEREMRVDLLCQRRLRQLVELVDDALEPCIALGSRRLLAQEHGDGSRQRRRARGGRLVRERDATRHRLFRLTRRSGVFRRVGLTEGRVEVEQREIREIRVGGAGHRELRRAGLRHRRLIGRNLT